jgi:hypothetical protein
VYLLRIALQPARLGIERERSETSSHGGGARLGNSWIFFKAVRPAAPS